MGNKEKMLKGKLYRTDDTDLARLRLRAHKLCQKYNNTFEDQEKQRKEILDKLLPNRGKQTFLQGPIFFDYGNFTTIGDNFIVNTNLTILDCAPVKVGNNVMMGPNISLVTPLHPLRYQQRNVKLGERGIYDFEYAKPIKIEDDCWLASNVTVNGGVRIGSGSVIGSNSVVTRNIPKNVLAFGNPCRTIRKITIQDNINQ